MLRSKSNLVTPIAAALALALASGGAMAATGAHPGQNATGQNSTSSSSQDNDAYREGQLWATYVMNPALQSYRIKTDVQGDKVTLTGTVDTKYEKLLAGNIAQQVDAINTVENQIKVDPAHIVVATLVPVNVYARSVSNATVSAEINSQLLWNEYTDGLDIDVSARDGKVTLTGVADTSKAKKRAGMIAANTFGVTSVDNQLTVSGNVVTPTRAPTSDDWVTDKLISSFLYTSGANSSDIDVSVDQAMVTLSGTVGSDMQRQHAIETAQQLLGVKGVKADDLRVVGG